MTIHRTWTPIRRTSIWICVCNDRGCCFEFHSLSVKIGQYFFYLFIFFRFQTNDPNNFTGVHQIWSETVKTAKLPLPQTTYIDFKNDSYMLPRPTVRRKQDCNGLVTLNFNKSTWNLLFQMRPFAEQAQDLLVPFTYLPIRDKCFIWSLIEAQNVY